MCDTMLTETQTSVRVSQRWRVNVEIEKKINNLKKMCKCGYTRAPHPTHPPKKTIKEWLEKKMLKKEIMFLKWHKGKKMLKMGNNSFLNDVVKRTEKKYLRQKIC